MSIEIREMRPDEREQVLKLHADAESDQASPVSATALIVQRNTFSVIARDEGSIVGAVICGRDDRGFQHCVAVAASHQDQPLARQMMDKAIMKFLAVGEHMCSHVHQSTEATVDAEFWEQCKWQPAE